MTGKMRLEKGMFIAHNRLRDAHHAAVTILQLPGQVKSPRRHA